MKIDVAVKFIIVLLVIMIISLTAALVIMNNGDGGEKETKPTVTTTAKDTTNPDTTTTPEQTTAPNTTSPDEIDPPELPEGIFVEKSFKSDTETTLNIRADVIAYENDGKYFVRVDVYLESYTITLSRAKYGVLTIGEKEFEFKLNKLSVENNKKIVSTLIYSNEVEVAYGEVVDIKADFAINMTYKNVKLETITAEGTVEVK